MGVVQTSQGIDEISFNGKSFPVIGFCLIKVACFFIDNTSVEIRLR